MAKNKLTDTLIKNLKPKDKTYKKSDGYRLYLVVTTEGTKYWRLGYTFAGKDSMLGFGTYPEVSLSEARTKREEAREQIRNNKNPSLERKKEKLALRYKAENTFEAVAKQWVERKAHEWTKGHAEDVFRSLELNIFPKLGRVPLADINSPMVREVLETVQARGALEATKRLRQRCGAVFRYGQALGLCDDDPSDCLKDILIPPKKQNYPALRIDELPQFLNALNRFNSNTQTRLAMRFMMLTFVRTGELINGEWSEIDFESAIWNIPAERMKRRRPHYIPLSHQSLEALRALNKITGHRELMFPKRGKPREPMSNATILRVIERVGYKGRMTGHGFRSIASTALNESGKFRPDAIERQLSHEQNDDVRAAYNRAEYIKERVEMMQWWADYLDRLEASPNVVHLTGA